MEESSTSAENKLQRMFSTPVRLGTPVNNGRRARANCATAQKFVKVAAGQQAAEQSWVGRIKMVGGSKGVG